MESVGTVKGLDHEIQGHEGSRHPLPLPYDEVLKLCWQMNPPFGGQSWLSEVSGEHLKQQRQVCLLCPLHALNVKHPGQSWVVLSAWKEPTSLWPCGWVVATHAETQSLL